MHHVNFYRIILVPAESTSHYSLLSMGNISKQESGDEYFRPDYLIGTLDAGEPTRTKCRDYSIFNGKSITYL
ncbi:MAG TPA: hypothetical protein DCM62_03425 [Bacteroidales bacterium]|nr:hypothetical protein [Bacteroidales bacterium]